MQQNVYQSIAKMLTKHGYAAAEAVDHVTVLDPVHTSMPGGRLVLTEHRAVVLRSFAQAVRFLNARSEP